MNWRWCRRGRREGEAKKGLSVDRVQGPTRSFWKDTRDCCSRPTVASNSKTSLALAHRSSDQLHAYDPSMSAYLSVA